MKIFFKIWLLILMPNTFLIAQEKNKDSSDRFIQLNEVVISSNKFNEKKKFIVQRIDLISAKYIAKINTQNTGDLLMSTGNVFIQKSQQGGSSPVIRGFEASRILLVVDGIRMNNAIYRAGHLQNVITVDQNMLQGIEVMFGPSSTMYGSDALGGSINMITKPVILAEPGEHLLVKGSVFGRYSTVNKEKTGHFDLNLGYEKLGFMTSFTYSDFGDMKMGDNYPEKYPDFGRRSKYVTQPNGSFVDSVVKNADDRIQKYSGYQQWDFMQKIRYKQSEKINHIVNLQFSNTSNVPRYDRLQDERGGTLRFAEWFYGPQKRNLYAYTFEASQLRGFFNELRFTASYQDIEESRQTRDYKRYDRFDSRREKIKVSGFVLDTRKIFGNNELTIGADAQLNNLKSVADRTNLQTGALSTLDTRYPNGENSMNSFGVFAQHLYKFKNSKWVLNDGLRFQANKLHSTIEDNSFFNLPVTDIKQSPSAFTGNLGLVYLPSEASRLTFGLASGFRAPNIDDVARIFESSTALKRVVVPNPYVKPEYTYTADINYSYLLAKKIKFEAGAYYTIFRNAMGLAPYSLNGQDSIFYNGAMCQVVSNQNINKAFLYGFNAAITADLNEHFSFLTTINYTFGRLKTDPEKSTSIFQRQPDGTFKLVSANVSEKPLDHIPPIFGKTSIQYRNKILLAEAFALYNGWKKLDQYNPDGEDNPQYATVDGMPGWITLNLRASVQVNTQFQIQAGLDNIFDRNYRHFASGFSSPGRNLFVTVRAGF
jgi:hemoglobin/transferrin/lactoferrin receptor protein